MKNIIFLVITTFLSACTLSPTATMYGSNKRYETHSDKMNAWVGTSERELLNKWGNPDEVNQISSTSKIYLYRTSNPFTIIGCTSAFQIDQNKVTKWGYKGCPIRENKKDYALISNQIPVPKPTLDMHLLEKKQ